jgi:hypothetical protein
MPNRRKAVVTRDHVRPGAKAAIHYCRQRHHPAGQVADVDALYVLRAVAEFRLRLQVHAPNAAEAAKVVDIEGAEIRLQRPKHIGQTDTHHLLEVDLAGALRRELVDLAILPREQLREQRVRVRLQVLHQ